MLALLPPAMPKTLRHFAAWLVPRRVPALIVFAALTLLALIALSSSKLNARVSLYDVALHPAQAEEVERALLIWNEPFSTDSAHTEVFVNASSKRDILLRLALANLPHPYVPTTADVMEQQLSAFAPQSVVDDRRRAGIEGDLVASLRRMNGVADAAVVIAPATDDPLSESDSRTTASASVQMMMQSGVSLTPTQIAGIKRFVAASYPGLSADRVVVVDAAGADATANGVPHTVTAREASLQASIQSALDAVFGAGATIVRVSMRTADEDRTSQSTLVTPHGLLESERVSETGSGGGKNLSKERSHTRYAYNTLVETRTAHADALTRVSVAVFVDSKQVSLAQTRLITGLVRAAAGARLDSDQVTVEALPFRRQVLVLGNTPRRSIRVYALLGLLALGLASAFFWSKWLRRTPRTAVDDEAARTLHASLQNEMPQTAAYVLGTLPRSMRDRVLRAYAPQQRLQIMAYMNGRARD